MTERTRLAAAVRVVSLGDEFAFRFNRRHSRHRGLLFYRLLEGRWPPTRTPYNTLTSESAA